MAYIIRGKKEDKSTWYIDNVTGFIPKDYIGDAPIDPLTLELEDTAWLQIENVEVSDGNFKEMFTVNELLKSQIQDQRRIAKGQQDIDNAAKAAEHNDIKDQLLSLVSVKTSNINDINKALQTLAKAFVMSLDLKQGPEDNTNSNPSNRGE